MKAIWLLLSICAVNIRAEDQITNCDCFPSAEDVAGMCFVYCGDEPITADHPDRDGYLSWIGDYMQSTSDKADPQPWANHSFFLPLEQTNCGKGGENIHKLKIATMHFKHCAMPNTLLKIYAPTQLQTLNMSHQNLKTIEPHAFDQGSHLETLIASHNRLEQIPDHIFVGANHLKTVDFSFNRIQSLTAKALNSGKTLIELNLAVNNIKEVDPEAFSTLDNLEKLDLSSNVLRKLGANAFAGAHRLKSLNLSNNFINSLNSHTFNNLTELETLIMRTLDLDSLPIDIFVSLPALKHLDMSFGQVAEIKLGTFSFNRNLERLDLSFNILKRFDFGLLMPRRPLMTDIILDSNQLTDLEGFSKHFLPNLKTLAIADNQFTCENLEEFFRTQYWDELMVMRNVTGIDAATDRPNINGIECKEPDYVDVDSVEEPQPNQFALRQFARDALQKTTEFVYFVASEDPLLAVIFIVAFIYLIKLLCCGSPSREHSQWNETTVVKKPPTEINETYTIPVQVLEPQDCAKATK